jgi:hypothetical protein
MGRLAFIRNRIYSDYFMGSRMEEYEKIILELCKCGYEHTKVRPNFRTAT